MGQYYRIVNLDKKEFLSPYKLDSGAKAWEQLANIWPGRALVTLVLSSPEQRGGGDLGEDEIIGRWAGDRIIMVGDYAEDIDRPYIPEFGRLYSKCCEGENGEPSEFADITELLHPLFERELDVKITRSSWGHGFQIEDKKLSKAGLS